jgi:isopentenyl phosphate kinase
MRVFLKLGGSLITDKDQPYTARRDMIARIAAEIAASREANPDLQILLGHGSGSFGHYAAKDLGTRDHVDSPQEWLGFQKVWSAAHALNQIVLEEMAKVDLPVISLPPSAAVSARGREPRQWSTYPIQSALEHNLIPVIFGDVIFDEELGGIIYSTEDLFLPLLPMLQPQMVLLAGKEPGVWADYPHNTRIIPLITPASYSDTSDAIRSSASIDVTGGMAAKVQLMLQTVQAYPDTTVYIFSGEEKGSISSALQGKNQGTTIKN